MSPEQLSLFGAPAAPAPKKRAEKEVAEKIVAPSAASATPTPVDPLSLPEPPKDRPQERMAWLTTILEHHNYLYHTLDKPVISDDQYDALFRELKALEEDHPQWAQPPFAHAARGGRFAGRSAQTAPPSAHVRSGQRLFRRGVAGIRGPHAARPARSAAGLLV